MFLIGSVSIKVVTVSNDATKSTRTEEEDVQGRLASTMVVHPRHVSNEEDDHLGDDDSSVLLGYDEENEEDGGDFSDREASSSSKHSRNTTHSQSTSSSHPMSLLPRTRTIFLIVILLAAIAIGTTAYVLTARSQNQAFETQVRLKTSDNMRNVGFLLSRATTPSHGHTLDVQYYSFCDLILESTQASSERLLTSVQSFSDSITTYTVATDATWPFVTVPNFEILGFKSNQISRALSLTFSPLVSSNDLGTWEEYANSSHGWLDQGLQAQSLLSSSSSAVVTAPGGATVRRLKRIPAMAMGSTRRVLSSASIPNELWSFDSSGKPHPVEEVAEAAGGKRSFSYAPVWQQSPTPSNTSVINYDLLSNPELRAIYDVVRVLKRPVLSSALDLEFLYSGSKINLFNTSGSSTKDERLVTSLVMSPLYPFVGTNEDAPQQGEILLTGEMSGILLTVIEWSRYLNSILPSGVNGIVAVLSNTCGQTFTYQINGPEAVFVGDGDLHDSNYDTFVVSSGLTGGSWLSKSNETTSGAACMYTVQLYPSSTFQDIYLDERPVIYTTVVVLLFAFTAAIFWLYDLLVRRRQAKVNATTKKSNAILSSLFPSTVRDRILKEAEEQAEQEIQHKNQVQQTLRLNKRSSFAVGNKALLRDFLDEEGDTATNQAKAETGAPKTGTSKPIADLFPETSVCFADLVGFTAWSSVREPTQVFQLLETIYHAFDKIAKRQNVFKVFYCSCLPTSCTTALISV
jgi:cytoskeletal protein RodZ